MEEVSDELESFIYLNKVAGNNGVGRVDLVENRFVGIKSRGVYETPAGTVLRAAHYDLEGVTMDREVMRIRDTMSVEFSRLCYNGFWFAPEMEMVMNSIDFSQRNVTGSVRVKLYKGNVIILGRESPCALYNADLASMDIEGGGSCTRLPRWIVPGRQVDFGAPVSGGTAASIRSARARSWRPRRVPSGARPVVRPTATRSHAVRGQPPVRLRA